MDFQLTDEQKALVAVIKDFGKREITPEFMKGAMETPLEGRLSYLIERGIYKKIQEMGIKALPVPVEYGGGGIDFLTEVIVQEAMSQYWAGVGVTFATAWKVCRDVADFGSKEQKEWFFGELVNNPNFLSGHTTTEPDHGSDPRMPYEEPGSGLKTYAVRDGDEWVINGGKCFCGGAQADVLLVFLRTKKTGPLSESMGAIFVPKGTPGFNIERVNTLMLDGWRPNCDITFDNVRVPATNLLGEENKAFDILDGHYVHYLTIAAAKTAECQRIYDLTKEYAQTRVQGGKPIIKHPTVAIQLAELYSRLQDVRLKVYKTAWEVDQATERGRKTYSTLNLYLSDLAARQLQKLTVETATDIWGGRSALAELPIESFIRGVWCHYHEMIPPSMTILKAASLLYEGDPYAE
jgi:alkylation response protein AidB-like acyl-CoA dehydrogenase